MDDKVSPSYYLSEKNNLVNTLQYMRPRDCVNEVLL
jgi:hypothetical protein